MDPRLTSVNRAFRRILYEVLDHNPRHQDIGRFFRRFQKLPLIFPIFVATTCPDPGFRETRTVSGRFKCLLNAV